MKKISIFVMIIIFGILLVSTGIYGMVREARLVNYTQGENEFYELFINKKPVVNEFFYGEENAPIWFIAFLDFDDANSRKFIEEIFPQIEKDFILDGKIKYFHKNYLIEEDYREKNDNFIYSQSLLCFQSIKKEVSMDFYKDLFYTNVDDINLLVEKYNISVDKFNNCFENNIFDELKQDVLDLQKSNSVGINPIFYIGILEPDVQIRGVGSYRSFERIIKSFQRRLGEE